MDIKEAINKLTWRFTTTGTNRFNANQNDIDAFNEILKTIKEHQEQQWKQNELFAKLYIFVYMRFISKMGATVMDTEPRKAMFKILEKPIEQWIEEFKDEMNDSEMYSILKDAGIELKHPMLGNEVDPKKEGEIIESLEKVWNYEMVKDCLTAEINNALNNNK